MAKMSEMNYKEALELILDNVMLVEYIGVFMYPSFCLIYCQCETMFMF